MEDKTVKQLAKKFIKDGKEAVKKTVEDKQIFSTKEEYDNRLKICEGCESFKSPFCTECKCLMFIKAKFHGFTCPKGNY